MSVARKIDKNLAIKELWRRGILSFKLHAAQLTIYNLIRTLPKDQREALLFCSRRFGKSFLGAILALEDCLRTPNIQVAIVGPTLKQTKKILSPIIKTITKDAPKGLVSQRQATDTWHMANGSMLMLGGFDTILESMRGLELRAIYLEETGLATEDYEEYNYLLYSVLFPTLQLTQGRIHHLTTPARIVDHPLHFLTLPKCKLANAFYEFTIRDNPMLSPEDIDKEIELLGGLNSITVQRELFCKIIRDDAITVVTTFNDRDHVSNITPTHTLKWTVGGDLGYTEDLSGFVLGGYDHNLGKILVTEERWFPPTTASKKLVDELEQAWGSYSPTYIVDIQGNTRTDMSAMGFSTVTPIKDKFDSTITFIRNEFYKGNILINPSCKLLIETLRSLTFNKNHTDFRRTATLGHGDMLMALVYFLRSIDKQTDLRPKPNKSQVFIPPYIHSAKYNNIKKLGFT